MATTKTIEVASSTKKSKKFGSFNVRAYSYNVIDEFSGTTDAEKFADALSLTGSNMGKVVSLLKSAFNQDAKREAFQNAGGQDLKLMRMAQVGIRAGVFASVGVTEDTPENIRKVAEQIKTQMGLTA